MNSKLLAIDCETIDEIIFNLQVSKDCKQSIFYERRKINILNVLSGDNGDKFRRILYARNLEEKSFLNLLNNDGPLDSNYKIIIYANLIRRKINSTQMYIDKDISLKKLKIPFQGIIFQLVDVAFKLNINNKNIDLYFTKNSLDELKILLARQISDYLAPSLYKLFLNYKKLIEKKYGKDYLNSFDEFEKNFWPFIAKKYINKEPIIAVLAYKLISNWAHATNLLIERVLYDNAKINKFLNVTKFVVKKIQVGLSDPHNGGQMVAILCLDKNKKIVYKPRSSLPEIQARNLFFLLKKSKFPGEILIPKSIDCCTHSWHQFIEHEKSDTLEDVKSYFFNIGCALGAFRLSGGTDFHQENIIAKNIIPTFIDLETMVQPPFTWDTGHPDSVTKAYEILYKSVYKSHILPVTLRTASGSLMQMGGLLALSEYKSNSFKFININENSMEYKEVIDVASPQLNLPVFENKVEKPSDYVDLILNGFNSFIEKFNESGDLIAKFKLNNRVQFRIILRPTESYYSILNSLKNPLNFSSGLKWSIGVEFDFKGVVPKDYPLNYSKILKVERESLLNLDIPYFNCNTGSRTLFSSGKIIREKFFDITPNNYLKTKFNNKIKYNLKYDDLAIRLSLEGSKNADIQIIKSGLNSNRLENPKFELSRLFNIIHKNSILSHDNATFISRKNIGKYGSEIGPLGYGMYSGLCGIAIFTAAYSKIFKNKKSHDLTNSLIKTVTLSLQNKGTPEPQYPTIIGIDGIGGIIYSAATIHQLSGSSEALKLSLDAAHTLDNFSILNSSSSCLLWGRAGAIIGLHKLFLISPNDFIIERIKYIADNMLIELNIIFNESMLILLGMAHGLSGIAFAFYKAFNITNDLRYLNEYNYIVNFLITHFSEFHSEWPVSVSSHRESADDYKYLSRWCDGSVGIFLMLAKTGFFNKNPDSFGKLFSGTIKNHSRSVDFLCCGRFGYFEMLMTIKNEFNSFQVSKFISEAFNSNLNSAKFYTYDAHGDDENLSLFRGCSGIGYSLLRNYDNKLPCLLSFD
jgi:type 2 lantibiotic biosynthesis protein LanM